MGIAIPRAVDPRPRRSASKRTRPRLFRFSRLSGSGGTFFAETSGNWPDSVVDRGLGSVRRKLCPDRRNLACSRSGAILSIHGNSVDYPVEAADYLDSDWFVQTRFLGAKPRLKFEATALTLYNTDDAH